MKLLNLVLIALSLTGVQATALDNVINLSEAGTGQVLTEVNLRHLGDIVDDDGYRLLGTQADLDVLSQISGQDQSDKFEVVDTLPFPVTDTELFAEFKALLNEPTSKARLNLNLLTTVASTFGLDRIEIFFVEPEKTDEGKHPAVTLFAFSSANPKRCRVQNTRESNRFDIDTGDHLFDNVKRFIRELREIEHRCR